MLQGECGLLRRTSAQSPLYACLWVALSSHLKPSRQLNLSSASSRIQFLPGFWVAYPRAAWRIRPTQKKNPGGGVLRSVSFNSPAVILVYGHRISSAPGYPMSLPPHLTSSHPPLFLLPLHRPPVASFPSYPLYPPNPISLLSLSGFSAHLQDLREGPAGRREAWRTLRPAARGPGATIII